MSVFYDKYIDYPSLQAELMLLLGNSKRVDKILAIFDEALHHEVINTILQSIPPEIHEPFIMRFKADPADIAHFSFLEQYEPAIGLMIEQSIICSRRKFIDAIHK